jgi:NADPH:quinone reductase-like Zn-dependent oxidoreductase
VGLEHIEATQLITTIRHIVPYGGLLRGRLAPGETVVASGATGAYGSAAVFLALTLGTPSLRNSVRSAMCRPHRSCSGRP